MKEKASFKQLKFRNLFHLFNVYASQNVQCIDSPKSRSKCSVTTRPVFKICFAYFCRSLHVKQDYLKTVLAVTDLFQRRDFYLQKVSKESLIQLIASTLRIMDINFVFKCKLFVAKQNIRSNVIQSN